MLKIAIALIQIFACYCWYKVGFIKGVRKEQAARLGRLNALKKLLNTRE